MGKNSARRFLYLATMIVIVLILFLQNKYISVCLAIAFSLGAGVFCIKYNTFDGCFRGSSKNKNFKKR